MRVGLISPLIQSCFREEDLSSKWPPLGLLYISSSLEKAGHTILLLERRLLYKDVRDASYVDKVMLEKISSFKPDLIGISATTPLMSDATHTARIIKAIVPNTKVVIGGVHPTILPEETLCETPEVDIIVIGEGERTICRIAGGEALSEIKGIAYREDGKIRINGTPEFNENMDDISFPARSHLDSSFYFSPDASLVRGHFDTVTSLITSRGCPFKCYFCSNDTLSSISRGRRVRYHSPEYVISEIDDLVSKYKVKKLVFADDMFLTNKNRAKQICDLMIKNKFHKLIKWTANVRADSIDEDLIRKIKMAGCAHLVIGLESGSQRMLDGMNKNVKVEVYYKAAKILHFARMPFEVNTIHGLPDEREEDFLQTIDMLKKIKPDRIFCSKLYPMPGSVFYNRLISQKRMVIDTYDDIFNKYYVSDFTFADMTYSEFKRLCGLELRKIILPTNYRYAIKNNLRRPLKALKYTLLLFIHPLTFYFPDFLRQFLLGITKRLRIRPA